MKQGFSLLEFVIGMMIGSLLLTEVFVIYNGIAKSTQTTQRFSSIDTQLIITQNRIQTDLNGLCPLWFDKEDIASLKKDNKASEKEEKQPDAKTTQEIASKKQPKLFFYAQSQDKTLDFFTFITTNALQSYGVAHTPLVRVVYRLRQDKKNAEFLQLTRQETKEIDPEFDIKKLDKTQEQYPILNNITSCSVSYGYIKEIEQQKTNQTDQKINKKEDDERKVIWAPEFKAQKADQGTNKKEEQVKQPATPKYIKITLECMVQNKKQKHELFFTIPINTSMPEPSIAKIMIKQNNTTSNNNPTLTQGATNNPANPSVSGDAHAN